MSKFKFTPGMFLSKTPLQLLFGYNEKAITVVDAASYAQAALDKHLESLPKIKRSPGTGTFSQSHNYGDETHTAVLFNLEPIEKAECEHEHILLRYESKNPRPVLLVDCAKCGAKLKAKWEVVQEALESADKILNP